MKKQYVIYLLFMGCIGFALLPQQARAQASIEQLNQKVQSIEATNAKNNRDVARALNLMTQIQQDFQSVKGQIEASKYLTQESDRVYKDLDLRVSTLEDKIDQIHQLMKELVQAQKSGTPTAGTASPETGDFQTLLTMVNARDYASAAAGFLGFIKKYPQSSMVPKAQFWVGESYYFMGDYARAIKEFQSLVEKYPQDPRVSEAIYRQGLSFSRLKKNDEAKLFFQKVMAAYPNSAVAAKAQTRLHQIEEMEKNQVALGDAPKTSATPPAERPEVSADRPVYKLSPYGKPAGESAPSAGGSPAPQKAPVPENPVEGQVPEPEAGPPTDSSDSSTPLF